MNCFEELTDGSVCSNCGYDNDTQVSFIYLQPKTILNNRYAIGALLCHESDAATYMAYDMDMNKVVCVREFLPKGIATRLDGSVEVHIREKFKPSYDKLKESFIKLWSTISELKNLSAVIPTYDVFELNETAYAVSEYMETITLRDFLLRNPDGNILWDRARIMFMPVLTTLEALHANGIIHGGICPDNLVLCRDGKVRLKGFCIAEANTMSSELEFNVNDGYTALEQYDNNHKMCPATDIYAFSACIFRALVGQNPPDAKSRETNDKLMIPNTIAEKIPTYVIRALGGGLQIYPEKRTQDIETFREQLNASPTVQAAASREEEKKEGKEPKHNKKDEDFDPIVEEKYYRGYPGYDDKPKKNGTKIAVIILIILIIAAIGAGVYVAKNGGFGKEEDNTSQSVAAAQYEVPDFVSAGYTQSDIENNGAWNKQFKLTFVSKYSTDAEEGIVFEQSIEPGKKVDEQTEIQLTVSKGVQTESVPNVAGQSLDEAKKTLEDKGFKVSTVEIYNDGSHEANTVKESYASAPAAGETVAVGEEIVLQVYGEVQTTTTSVEPENEAGTD